jgi:UDP-glucose 4-epimerase
MTIVHNGASGEIYNVGSSTGISIQELVNKINRITQVDGHQIRQHFMPERPFDVHYNVLNTDKLKQLTCWQPETSLHAGITQTWNWIKGYIR